VSVSIEADNHASNVTSEQDHFDIEYEIADDEDTNDQHKRDGSSSDEDSDISVSQVFFFLCVNKSF